MSAVFKSTADVLDAALPDIADLPPDFIAALDRLADALAALIMCEPQTWNALCRREAEAEVARIAWWHAHGAPLDDWPPERTVGRIVLEAFAIRYPHFLQNRRPKEIDPDAAE